MYTQAPDKLPNPIPPPQTSTKQNKPNQGQSSRRSEPINGRTNDAEPLKTPKPNHKHNYTNDGEPAKTDEPANHDGSEPVNTNNPTKQKKMTTTTSPRKALAHIQ